MVSQRHTGSRIGRIYQLEVGWRGEDWTTGTRSGSVGQLGGPIQSVQ